MTVTALRLAATVAVLIAAGILLFVAGFGIFFAISTASDGIGGSDERAEFTSALIEATSLPGGVALLIAGTALWQRSSRAIRTIRSGIGLMFFPFVAAWIFGPDRMSIPIWQMLALVLPLALSGLAATYWLRTHDISSSTPSFHPPSHADARNRKRRIASLIIALIATVPVVPLVYLLAAVSFDPPEADQEPDAWAGIAVIIFGIAGVALVIVAARALARPQSSMKPFGAVAVCYALAGLVSILTGELDYVLLPILGSALSLFLGWLSRLPGNQNES